MPSGYSGTPLAKKLGIKEGHAIALLGAPRGFTGALERLPEGVKIGTAARGTSDVIVSFHTERADLEARVPRLLDALDVNGGLWIAWPKKASKVPTDISEDTVREVFLPLGLVDNKVCAIDEVWSGLRVVWRKENRPKSSA
ncbi:MAG: hypothetical protein QOH79_376 [Acidimicrobiaceae bacterium]